MKGNIHYQTKLDDEKKQIFQTEFNIPPRIKNKFKNKR